MDISDSGIQVYMKWGGTVPALSSTISRRIGFSRAHMPGSGDLAHCLATIKRWPLLQEGIWTTFFAGQSTTVRADCRTVNDQPFMKGRRLIGTTVMWHVGWRRNDAYAEPWVDVSHLTGEIRDYFDNPTFEVNWEGDAESGPRSIGQTACGRFLPLG